MLQLLSQARSQQGHGLMSVLRGLLVLGVGHRKEVLQLPLQSLESWPFHRVLIEEREGIINDDCND